MKKWHYVQFNMKVHDAIPLSIKWEVFLKTKSLIRTNDYLLSLPLGGCILYTIRDWCDDNNECRFSFMKSC